MFLFGLFTVALSPQFPLWVLRAQTAKDKAILSDIKQIIHQKNKEVNFIKKCRYVLSIGNYNYYIGTS